MAGANKTTTRPGQSQRVYDQLKAEIFDFQLLPGQRFTESEIAERMAASRTPVREALYRLQQEGQVSVQFRNGWQVRPFDFRYFQDLYDLRIVIEREAVLRLSSNLERVSLLEPLQILWNQAPAIGTENASNLADLDEAFHTHLVLSLGNAEMSRVHQDCSQRLRVVRRLDFSKARRIAATYREHTAILAAIVDGQADTACQLLSDHITTSSAEVRSITLHRIHQAHTRKSDRFPS